MKVSELSARAGVPLPTIKFYIREGLLPPGERTGRNQADYSEEHLERLALIRALRDDAGLGIAAISRALKAADTAKEEPIGAALDAIERPTGARVAENSTVYKQAKAELLELIERRGWELSGEELSVRDATRALALVRRSYPKNDLAVYAEAMESIALHELPATTRATDAPNAALRYALLGTVLMEPFLLALRRMAHASRSRQLRGHTVALPPTRESKPGKRKPRG